MNNQDRESRFALNPLWLFITSSLPLVILAGLLFQGYMLIRQEMTEQNATAFWQIMTILLADFVICSTLGAWSALKKKTLSLSCFFLLPLQIISLVCCLVLLGNVCPANVSVFIFSEFEYFLYMFIFFTPSIFHQLFCISLKRYASARKEAVIATLSIISIPLCFYLFTAVGSCSPGNFQTSIVITIFISMMTVFFIGLLKLLRFIVTIIYKRGAFSEILCIVIVALVLPIAGLLLNMKIPFPCDFQCPDVYVLTALNALVLLLPLSQNPKINYLIFLLKIVFYPFCLYFFLVFLPFLTLSVFAILAAGLGFLILAPTLLFYVQTRQIITDFAALRQYFSKWTLIITVLAGMIVIPAIISFRAINDRTMLYQAIDFVYSTDFDKNDHAIYRKLPLLKRTLQKMYVCKNDVQMPFIDNYYKWLVFDNLAMPDEKLEDMYLKLFGEKLKSGNAGLFAGGRRSSSRFGARQERRPQTTELIAITQTKIKQNFGCSTYELTLKIKNDNNWNSEYVAEIAIQPGVFIVGCDLMINNKYEPGKIFEKKSALWIYEKIKSERRDPLIIYYSSPQTVKLKIFPFGTNETRYAKLRILVSDKLGCNFKISGKNVSIPAVPNEASPPGCSVLSVAEVSRLPAVKRQPVIDFVVDASCLPAINGNGGQILKDISSQLGIKKFYLTVADIIPHFVASGNDINQLPDFLAKFKNVNGVTGFMPERALKSRIIDWNKNNEGYFPVIVLISDKNHLPDLKDFISFSRLLPETGFILFCAPGGRIEQLNIENGTIQPFSKLEFRNVRQHHEKIIPDGEPYIYAEKQDSGIYAQAVALQQQYTEFIRKPSMGKSEYARLVSESKKSGVMIPNTSYIILETLAQWEKLKQTENKKLKNNQELEIEEVKSPEPDLKIMLAVLAAALFMKFIVNFCKKKKA